MTALRIVYFVTVFLLLYNDVTAHIDFSKDDQSIEIYPGNSNNPYLILKNTSHLIFKNFTGTGIECTYGDQQNHRQNYETQGQFNFTNGRLNIISLANFMSTRWECTGYHYNGSTTTKYIFIIKVKAAKKVNVTISGENVEFKITNLSVKEYDGVYEYACAEGDTIDLICKNPHETGQINLKYYDANGLNIFETYHADKYLTFLKLVRDKNVNGSYIECSYITPIIAVEQTYTYRIIFTVTTLKSSGFIVTINDMKLSAMSGDIYKYEYKFVDWVPLKLTCEVKDQNLENLTMINNKNIVMRDIKKTPSKYSAVIETNNLDGAIFDCHSEHKVRASISFLKDPYRDPFIHGLRASNILYQYNTDDSHWIIHYQYETSDVLNLTCFTEHDRQPKWKYNRENITSTVHFELKKNSRYIMDYFHMNDKSNKDISCESNKTGTNTRAITIILHPISGLVNSDFENNSMGDELLPSTQHLSIKDVPLNLTSEGLHLTVPKVIGIVAGVVITVVTVICAFYWWRSRRIILTKEEAPYRNFNQEEYHEYTYIQSEYDKMKNEDSNMKINDLYIGGGLDNPCKTMTAPTENQYTEIDMKGNPDGMSITYAVPYEVHNINKTETSGNQNLYNNLCKESENKSSNVSYGNLKKHCSNLSYDNMRHLYEPSYKNLNVNNSCPRKS